MTSTRGPWCRCGKPGWEESWSRWRTTSATKLPTRCPRPVGSSLLNKVPAAVIQRLEPPRVHRVATDWHVWNHALCYSDKTFGISGPTCRTIRMHHFVIHQDGYRVRSEDLWDGKDEER